MQMQFSQTTNVKIKCLKIYYLLFGNVRSMTLRYNMPTEYNGLTGNQFLSTKDMLDNGTNVPSRACYCKDVECQPSGTFNVSMCKFGAPAFISSPHFYLADESYRSAIDGMNPRKEDHQFSMVVEPVSNTLMQNKLPAPYFSSIYRSFFRIPGCQCKWEPDCN